MTHSLSVRSVTPVASEVFRPCLRFLKLTVLAWMLAGCSAMAGPWAVGEEAEAPIQLSPLRYYHWVVTASPQEIFDERLRLETNADTSANVVLATQLALLLSASPLAELESAERARALLEAPRSAPLPWAYQREYAIFADLWLGYLNQQKSMEELSEAKSVDQQQIAELQRQIQQLEKKIEALTSIEQQLIEREQAQDLD